MRNIIEYVEHRLPSISRAIFQKFIEQRASQNILARKYSYDDITQACDQSLTRMPNDRNQPPFRNALGETETFRDVYNKLNKADSPAPISAAVIIGLGRADNLHSLDDVDMLRRTHYLLSVINNRWYQRFCNAIDQSIRSANLMRDISRPDFASFSQLASLATLIFRVLRTSRQKIRYEPYVTADGQIISQKDFNESLGGGELGSACVRFVVDLGVLTTQPEKIDMTEKEWCRRTMYFNKLVDHTMLHERLEKFTGLL